MILSLGANDAEEVYAMSPIISDHLQNRWYEEGPWKGPSSLVALARSLVADSVWRIFTRGIL